MDKIDNFSPFIAYKDPRSVIYSYLEVKDLLACRETCRAIKAATDACWGALLKENFPVEEKDNKPFRAYWILIKWTQTEDYQALYGWNSAHNLSPFITDQFADLQNQPVKSSWITGDFGYVTIGGELTDYQIKIVLKREVSDVVVKSKDDLSKASLISTFSKDNQFFITIGWLSKTGGLLKKLTKNSGSPYEYRTKRITIDKNLKIISTKDLGKANIYPNPIKIDGTLTQYAGTKAIKAGTEYRIDFNNASFTPLKKNIIIYNPHCERIHCISAWPLLGPVQDQASPSRITRVDINHGICCFKEKNIR